MSKENLTEIVCIIDKSGSMDSVRKDAIGGFNSFIDVQKKVPGDATLTLILFDTIYEVCYEGKNIKDVSNLDEKSYIPCGCTALLDSLGKTINSVGARLSKTLEQDRPSKVIFVILTDGEENSSKEFTKKQINDMITLQRDTYKWEFIYLAANQDAIKEASHIGIASANAFNYVGTPQGTRNIYNVISNTVSSFRATGDSSIKEDISTTS